MDTDRWMAGLNAHAHSLRCEVSAVKASEHITPSVWWTGLLLKSLSHPRGCLMARQTAAGGKMERNSQDKGRGEGALHLSKMASVAMQLGTKAIYTPALLSPPPPTHTNTTPFFFPPQAPLPLWRTARFKAPLWDAWVLGGGSLCPC